MDTRGVTLRGLEHDSTARSQHRERAARDCVGRAFTDERGARLPVAHLGPEHLDLVLADVRRIRHDEIPGPLGKTVEQVVVNELDGETSAGRVLARDLECVLRRVDRRDARSDCFVGDRECDRAAPGADVENTRPVDSFDPRQAALDDDLRLGSRNEHAGVDLQREAAKSPLAQHVRERLTTLAAGEEPFELLQ